MDGDSPLTSAASSVTSSDLPLRAGSETSQQSEGSSVKAKQRKVDDEDDDYKKEADDDEEYEEDAKMQQTSVTSSGQKRKRKDSRVILSDGDDDDEYSPTASSHQRQRSITSQSVSQERGEKKARSGHARSSSASKRKRPMDHTVHSEDDDKPFKASLLPSRQRSASAQSSSKDREMKRLQVEGACGENGQNFSSWGTRPKRLAKDKVPHYGHLPDDLDAQVQSSPVQEGRARRKVAKVSYVPQHDLNGNPLDGSDSEPSTSKAKKGRPKARPIKLLKATGESDPSSYDSLFDAHLLSEDDQAREQRKVAENNQKKISANTTNRASLAVKTVGDDKFAGAAVMMRNGMTYIPQYSNCMSSMQFQQCRYCVSRQSNDTCRFKGIRGLPVRVRSEGVEVLVEYNEEQEGPIFIDDATLNEEVVLPDHFDLNRPMDDDSKKHIMTTTAISLVGILKEALEHARKPKCIRRARELQIRAMCDYCSTGLFSASYICTRCGGEFCLPCQEAMKSATAEDRLYNQLYTCVKGKTACVMMEQRVKEKKVVKIGTHGKRSNKFSHSSDMMIPVSRFSIEELQVEVKTMEEVIEEHASSIPTSTMKPEAEQDGTLTSQPHSLGQGIPSQVLTRVSKIELDKAKFLSTWSRGEPLVVTEVSTKNLWDPAAFVNRYGMMDCDIVRCDEHPPVVYKERLRVLLKAKPDFFSPWEKPVKVHEFFETFGMPDEDRAAMFGQGIWKLKDWPPAAEFSTAFPDIYEDFNHAVPMPDFTRRDGCINISSLFPKNANGPDLGPKMYNAWPGEHSKGKKGTTCLHMDIADAVNILLYAAEKEGAEQAAQWDIFRAEDANAIRDFIRTRNPESANKGDPIHAQVHYLDDDALQDLYEQKGVYSWRILQRTGQAVFIPAGCAHQVCNLTDCIKVAVDFISPQNVARCFQLTEEFRGLTLEGRKSWKEDVLQLKAQLWYAWKACRALPPMPTDEEHQQEVMRRESRRLKQLKEEEEHERRRAAQRLKRVRETKPFSSPTKESITPEPTPPDNASKPAEVATLSAYPEDNLNTPPPIPVQTSDSVKTEES